ncbi:hypothetical protein TWF696_001702 [Orbilia brochopaga]|uniref:NAD(P)-binding protein n=1 Tax=Orbilia brochopaga TaxID=3140254 RepID=A0AAV9U5V1_9PEZI
MATEFFDTLVSKASQLNFRPSETTIKALAVTGAIATSYQIWKFFEFIHLYFLKPSTLNRYRAAESPKGEAPWALITGSSDGIGKCLANDLAKKGFNIIIHGRTREKLVKLSASFEKRYGIKTRTLSLDASDPSVILDDAVIAALNDIKITILINNVGGATVTAPATWQPLVDKTSEEVDRVISFNARFMTQLIRLVLPRMTEPGLIINISSQSSIGLPYVQLYSGSKGFVNAFSIAMNAEMYAMGRDIQVMSVTPSSVKGAGFKQAKGSLLPDADMISKAILDRVGSGRTVISPYWLQAAQDAILRSLPHSWYPMLVTGAVSALKKEEEEEELAKAKLI